MQRFRSTWLALMGGALLVTLSISAAFGADPSGTGDDARGQTIAAFVHQLVFGSDDEVEQDEESPEEELEEELEGADDLDEDESDETDETDEVDEVDAHGECVSEVARDKHASAEAGANHGTVVSEAAGVTCWEVDDEEAEDTDPEEDEEFTGADSHGACVSEVARDKSAIGGPNNNHGGAVSEATHECGAHGEEDEPEAIDGDASDDEGDAQEASATEQRNAEKAAARAERQAARDNRKAEPKVGGNGAGNGNGRGGGRP